MGLSCQSPGIGVELNSAPLQVLGTLSYSWYLWHWPFLVLAKALFPNIAVAGMIAVAAASLGVAGVTHYFVENPIRFHPYLIERPSRSIYLAVAITIVSLSAATLSMRFAGKLSNEPKMRMISAAADDISRLPLQQCVAHAETSDVKTCIFGDSSSAMNIALFGDSHAIQWFNPLQRIAESHRWKLTTFVKSGCPASDIRSPDSSGEFTTACDQWRAEAIRTIVLLRPSVVFLANAAVYLGRRDKPLDKKNISFIDWREGTRRTLQALAGRGLRVIVMRDNPLPPFDVPTCLARFARHSWYLGGSCEMGRPAVLDPAVYAVERAAAQNIQGVYFIDLSDQLCQNDICQVVREGEIMYRDDNHLTGSFADRLMPVLEERLLPILNTPPRWARAGLKESLRW